MDNSKLSKNNSCYLEVLPIEAKGETMVTKFKVPSSLGISAPFNMARFTLPCGAETWPDQHSVEEVWFIIHGSGILNYKNRPIQVAAGDAVYFESNEVHQLLNNGRSPIEVFSIWWGGEDN